MFGFAKKSTPAPVLPAPPEDPLRQEISHLTREGEAAIFARLQTISGLLAKIDHEPVAMIVDLTEAGTDETVFRSNVCHFFQLLDNCFIRVLERGSPDGVLKSLQAIRDAEKYFQMRYDASHPYTSFDATVESGAWDKFLTEHYASPRDGQDSDKLESIIEAVKFFQPLNNRLVKFRQHQKAAAIEPALKSLLDLVKQKGEMSEDAAFGALETSFQCAQGVVAQSMHDHLGADLWGKIFTIAAGHNEDRARQTAFAMGRKAAPGSAIARQIALSISGPADGSSFGLRRRLSLGNGASVRRLGGPGL